MCLSLVISVLSLPNAMQLHTPCILGGVLWVLLSLYSSLGFGLSCTIYTPFGVLQYMIQTATFLPYLLSF